MEEHDSSSSAHRTHYRRVKSRIFALIKCEASSDEDFGQKDIMTREEESLDWLYITIITLVVSCLDKVFDLLFILELAHECEWTFMALSLFFTVTSTLVTSLFAAQSFWVQSSTIPGWSRAWVEDVPKKRKVFLENYLYRPVNRRIVPHDSQFKVKQSIPESHETIAKSLSEVHNTATIFTITGHLKLPDAKGRRPRSREGSRTQHNASSNPETKPPYQPETGSQQHGECQVSSPDGPHGCTTCNTHVDAVGTTDAADGGTGRVGETQQEEEEEFEKQFRPWVRCLLAVIFCTGLLPEWVLMVNLSMYAGAGEDRRVVSCLLRDTWYVQTLKLGETLLESIPQIHLKVFYFLTRNSGAALPLSQVVSIVVSGVSIAVGFIEHFHVQIGYKVLGFILIFINLGTRVAVCAALDQTTTDGLYFAPFACAFLVSICAAACLTLVRHGRYGQEDTRFYKYITVPVMRTFCTPPADRVGGTVALVFVGAACVCCGQYAVADAVLAAVLVVVLAVLGQGLTGLLWYAVGISQINAENKRRRRSQFEHKSARSEVSAQQRF